MYIEILCNPSFIQTSTTGKTAFNQKGQVTKLCLHLEDLWILIGVSMAPVARCPAISASIALLRFCLPLSNDGFLLDHISTWFTMVHIEFDRCHRKFELNTLVLCSTESQKKQIASVFLNVSVFSWKCYEPKNSRKWQMNSIHFPSAILQASLNCRFVTRYSLQIIGWLRVPFSGRPPNNLEHVMRSVWK